MEADTGAGELLKGMRREEHRREEELGTARERERSMVGGLLRNDRAGVWIDTTEEGIAAPRQSSSSIDHNYAAI